MRCKDCLICSMAVNREQSSIYYCAIAITGCQPKREISHVRVVLCQEKVPVKLKYFILGG